MQTVEILGTRYSIAVRKYDEDEYFKRADCAGYCSGLLKEIVLCEMSTWPDWERETDKAQKTQMKTTLRHEIVHAFLEESGLSANSNESGAWACNEEMVDWIALQGPKLYAAWKEADCL